jgi:hypothetical protein
LGVRDCTVVGGGETTLGTVHASSRVFRGAFLLLYKRGSASFCQCKRLSYFKETTVSCKDDVQMAMYYSACVYRTLAPQHLPA